MNAIAFLASMEEFATITQEDTTAHAQMYMLALIARVSNETPRKIMNSQVLMSSLIYQPTILRGVSNEIQWKLYPLFTLISLLIRNNVCKN